MSTSVVLAVLFGALLHATWNALVKSSGDKQLDLALVHLLGALVSLPLLLWVGLPPVAAWPFIGLSLLIHVAYYITLNGAYQHGDLGSTYPIMRGSAPLLVALGSTVVLGESLSPAAWLGIAAVTVGVLMVGLARPGQTLHHGRAIAFALANAVVIAAYTIVDGRGVRMARENALALRKGAATEEEVRKLREEFEKFRDENAKLRDRLEKLEVTRQ